MNRLEQILTQVFEQALQIPTGMTAEAHKASVIAAAIKDINSNDPLKSLAESVSSLPRGTVSLVHSFENKTWSLDIKMHSKHKDVFHVQGVDPYKLMRLGIEDVKQVRENEKKNK